MFRCITSSSNHEALWQEGPRAEEGTSSYLGFQPLLESLIIVFERRLPLCPLLQDLLLARNTGCLPLCPLLWRPSHPQTPQLSTSSALLQPCLATLEQAYTRTTNSAERRDSSKGEAIGHGRNRERRSREEQSRFP
eukprot:381189-Rhodomonas_salina.1